MCWCHDFRPSVLAFHLALHSYAEHKKRGARWTFVRSEGNTASTKQTKCSSYIKLESHQTIITSSHNLISKTPFNNSEFETIISYITRILSSCLLPLTWKNLLTRILWFFFPLQTSNNRTFHAWHMKCKGHWTEHIFTEFQSNVTKRDIVNYGLEMEMKTHKNSFLHSYQWVIDFLDV